MKTLRFALALALAAADLAADEHPPVPDSQSIPPVASDGGSRAGEGETRYAQPDPEPPRFKPGRVPSRVTPPRVPAAAPAPLLRLRAVETRKGEAVVELDQQRRTLRPGELLGTDVVRVVEEGLLVLDRPAVAGRPEGAGLVIVRFDASGRPRLRVIYEQDLTTTPAAGATR